MIAHALAALIVLAPRVYAAYDLTCVAQRDGRPQCVGDPQQVELVAKLKAGRPLAYGISPHDACGIDSTATLQCNSGRSVSNVAAMRISDQTLWWQTRDNKICAGDVGSVNAGCSSDMKGNLVYGDSAYAYLSDGTLCSASALLKNDSGACGRDDRFKGVRAMTSTCAVDGIGQALCKKDVKADDWVRTPSLDGAIGLVQAGARVCAWADHGPLRCFDALAEVKPVAVPTLDCVVHATAGEDHVCAETCGDGEIRCLYSNRNGVLGKPVTRDRAEVKGVTAKAITAGRDHVCAIATDGAVSCWGANDKQQIGAAATTKLSSKPLRVNVPNATMVSAEADHTCSLSEDGHVWCWGDGAEPHVLDSVHDVTAVATSALQTCVVSGGKVACWSDPMKPRVVAGVSDAIAIDVADNGACAIRKSGQVVCWQKAPRAVPVAGMRDAVELTVDDNGGCAKRKAGHIECWSYGKRALPLANGVGSVALRGVSGTTDHCMVRDDGKVGCWGPTPTTVLKTLKPNGVTGITGLAGVIDVAAGPIVLCAIAKGGVIGCMADSGAVLGAGDLLYTDTPVRFEGKL